jgi:hypothetical protein
MLENFKSFNVDRLSIEELIALSAFGKSLRAEFVGFSVEVPEYVDNQLKTLAREIKLRNAENLESQLRDKKSRLEALTPAEEKREKIKADIEKLEAMLKEA